MSIWQEYRIIETINGWLVIDQSGLDGPYTVKRPHNTYIANDIKDICRIVRRLYREDLKNQ